MPADTRAWARSCFGLQLAGVGLLLPEDLHCEYVEQAEVFPVPGAPRGLCGLMHRHGRPVPVFRVDSQTNNRDIIRLRILILGSGRDAGAIVIDLPPEPVELLAAPDTVPAPPAWAAALPAGVLNEAFRVKGNELIYWRFEPTELFAALGGR